EVVGVGGVAVLGVARVGPAAQPGVVAVGVPLHRRQDVGGVDAAVAVDVGDLARALVDRVVQVGEGDNAVVVHVHEVFETAPRDLGLVDPDVLIKAGVVVVDAGVHYRHDDGAVPRGDVPGLGGADVGPRCAAVLAGVVHVPLGAEQRVVGNGRGAEQVVRL